MHHISVEISFGLGSALSSYVRRPSRGFTKGEDMSEKKTAEENVIETTETEAFEIIELAINDISVLTRAFTCISEAWGEEPLIESGPLEEDTQIVIH